MLTAGDLEKIRRGQVEEPFFDAFFRPVLAEVLDRVELTGCTKVELETDLRTALALRVDLPQMEGLMRAFIQPVVETALEKGSKKGLFKLKGRQNFDNWTASMKADLDP